MDASAATILAGVLGAVIGAPAGFFIERLVNRARLTINYAETAYEDVYALSESVRANLLRLTDFIQFVDAQVKWSLQQRLVGNLFNREELRQIREFGQHFADSRQNWSTRVQKEILPVLLKGGNEVDRLIPELETSYKQDYGSNLIEDLRVNRQVAEARLVDQHKLMLSRAVLGSQWLEDFLKHVDGFLKHGQRTSERVIVRISIGNSGYQDAIIQTEARLLVGSKTFRLPKQAASRPWETSETKGLSQFNVISPRSFLVLEFLVDENLNAKADLDSLRSQLSRSVKATLQVLGIGGTVAAKQSFVAMLQ